MSSIEKKEAVVRENTVENGVCEKKNEREEEKDDEISLEKSTKEVYKKLKKRLVYNIKEWQVIKKALEREGGELSASVDTCQGQINVYLRELNETMEGVILAMDEKLTVAEAERKKEETREWVREMSSV